VPRAGPKKVQEYSAEFKLAAVRLSRQRGVQVQAVAAALDIHPCRRFVGGVTTKSSNYAMFWASVL